MVILSLARLKLIFLKKLLFLLFTISLFACSTEKEQMETVRNLAVKDMIIQLQLPEGTKFNDEDIVVSEPVSDIEELGAIYVVNVTIKSQDASGAYVLKTHKLEYVKIGKGGLDPSDYELKSFD